MRSLLARNYGNIIFVITLAVIAVMSLIGLDRAYGREDAAYVSDECRATGNCELATGDSNV